MIHSHHLPIWPIPTIETIHGKKYPELCLHMETNCIVPVLLCRLKKIYFRNHTLFQLDQYGHALGWEPIPKEEWWNYDYGKGFLAFYSLVKSFSVFEVLTMIFIRFHFEQYEQYGHALTQGHKIYNFGRYPLLIISIESLCLIDAQRWRKRFSFNKYLHILLRNKCPLG